MSSRQHHQHSSLLLERSVSPPHLLSPELNPATNISASTPTSRLTNQFASLSQHPADTSSTYAGTEMEAPPGRDGARSTGTLPVAESTARPDENTLVPTTIPHPTENTSLPTDGANAHEVEPLQAAENDPTERTSARTSSPTLENTTGTDETTAIRSESLSDDTAVQEMPASWDPPLLDPHPEQPLSSIPQSETEPEDLAPSWVKYEEDTSVPSDEEMVGILESEADRPNPTNIHSMEEHFFVDLDDPDRRPAKKLRMTWLIKGVRGTHEKPNMARVMNSPAVCVDGMYWSIKFYPRGDSCEALSAFVRCSRVPPKQADEMPEHSFAFFQGPPDADFSKDYEPTVRVSAPNTQRVRKSTKPPKTGNDIVADEAKAGRTSAEPERPVSPESDAPDLHDEDDEDAQDGSDDVDDKDLEDWRIPAQLGMTIYNPHEPRTAHCQTDGHQFSQHTDDWGWVNFVGPWHELHKRKPGHRRPLLQNDMLAIDAYVRIYDDPTQALWWHESKTERHWPSKLLAGFYPMGTPTMYHSPAVAGITAWSILAPFRKIIQAHEGGKWLRDSAIAPTPLVCQTQIVLQQMRNLAGYDYVSVFKIIEELIEADETFDDVKSFWEVYRRGLTLELEGDESALKGLSDIFDAGGHAFEAPQLSVPGSDSIAAGLKAYFTETSYRGPLPNFLPVMLNRQAFDKETRTWLLHENRVKLSDRLDLTEWCTDVGSRYTLYGFVAHVNGRASGKFYSVLRPGGIGSKWLAFEDGHGNKVFSHTRTKIQEYEGLDEHELQGATGEGERVYLAMYIRDSCWEEYLPCELEPYQLPRWLRNRIKAALETGDITSKDDMLQAEADDKEQEESGIKVELHLDETVAGRENSLELHDLRFSEQARASAQIATVSVDKTMHDLRRGIAAAFAITDPEKVMLWDIAYLGVGQFCRAELMAVSYRRKVKKYAHPGEIARFWVTIVPHDGQKETYQNCLCQVATMGLAEKSTKASSSASVTEPVQASRATEARPNAVESSNDVDGDDPSSQPVDTGSNHTEDSNTTGLATPATGATGESGADVEQASVAAAVANDVRQAGIAATVSLTEVAATEETSRVPPQDLPDSQTTVQANASVAAEDAPLSTTLPLDMVVEQNHLVEPAQAVEIDSTPAAGLPIEEALSTDDISAEDAAVIAALLAADADEAARYQAATVSIPNPFVADGNTSSLPISTTADRESPKPLTTSVARVYGFVHTFDAAAQKFVSERPINPEVDSEINAAICKLLGRTNDLLNDAGIRVWKRDGPTGTARITGNATFADCNLHDAFTLIVGDELSEQQVEELKIAGKFWQPAQLLKHLNVVRRRHPILSLTSASAVEIAEFGADYFKGPIVNGRPHGENCLLITTSGHTYKGPFIAGLKSGKDGRMTFQNGDTYTGAWLNDECHGQGEHIEARTGNRYVGGFEHGKRWGEGVTYWKVADQQAAMCQVCYGEEIDALFFDCGHVCACVECAKQCDSCPICRKPIREVVKMYRA